MMTLGKQSLKVNDSARIRQTSESHFFCLSFIFLIFLSFLSGVTRANDLVLIPCEISTPETQKAYWSLKDDKIPVKRVVVMAPGLNLKASKLHSLANALTNMESEVLIVDLKPSDDWQPILHQALCIARKKARELKVPLVGLGHSLAALALLDLMTLPHHFAPDGFILLAPSFFPKTLARVIDYFDWIPAGALPSFNFPDYRVNDSTKFSTYKRLRILREHFMEKKKFVTIWPRTLILMSSEDELLDFKKTQEFAGLHSFEINSLNVESKKQKTIHHLIVDPLTMGERGFLEMLEIIGKYFNQFSP